MRGLMILGLVAGMAGCTMDSGTAVPPSAGPTDRARIADVQIRPSRLTIRMTDGARCVADRPEDEQGGWSGVTSDCGYQLPYDVVFREGGNPARFIVEESFGVVGADGTLRPRAEVYVIDVDGMRKQFISPLSESVRFQEVREGNISARTSG